MNNSLRIKARKSNIELLRIIAMLMIVGHHYAYHGVAHYGNVDSAFALWNQGNFAHRFFTSALAVGGEVGAAIFFLITGYFQINKKKASILKVSLETIFYGCTLTLLLWILVLAGISFPYTTSRNLIGFGLRAILVPITSGTWWFITAYAVLILAVPIINSIVNNLNRTGYLVLLSFTWLFLYTIDSFGGEYWHLERAVFFYLLGGFIRLYGKAIKLQYIYIVGFVLAWLAASGVEYLNDLGLAGEELVTILRLASKLAGTFNIAILYPICAVTIFRIFQSIDIGSNKTINTLAATTLGVYLIHDSIFGRSLIWNVLLKVDENQYFSSLYPVFALATILGVFASCSVIDYLRIKLIEPYMVRCAIKLKALLYKKYIAN